MNYNKMLLSCDVKQSPGYILYIMIYVDKRQVSKTAQHYDIFSCYSAEICGVQTYNNFFGSFGNLLTFFLQKFSCIHCSARFRLADWSPVLLLVQSGHSPEMALQKNVFWLILQRLWVKKHDFLPL